MQTKCHLSELVARQAKKYGNRIAITYRDYEKGKWIPISWNAFAKTVEKVSKSLLSLGTKVQENIAVFSQNMPQCLFVNFGAYGIRAVPIPFYATSSVAQVAYMVNDASVRFLFVGEQEQYDIAMSVMPLCDSLEKIVRFDKNIKLSSSDHFSISFEDFLSFGNEDGSSDTELSERLADACYTDVADILYTSGTTGKSKGVMLTYDMYREGFWANDRALPLSENDVILDFLPFTHVFERAWAYLCLSEGARLAINLRPTDVLRSLQEVKPTCMSSVPRFWEKVYQAVMEKMESGSSIQRKLIGDAIAVGSRYWKDYKSKCRPAPLSLALKYKLYDRTIIRYLRKMLGLENGNIFPTAGAAVSPQVEAFVHAAGLNMIVGYGLTESTATVSCDVPGKPVTIGSVGRVIEGLQVKFGENDEILLKGKTITPGYYKKESTTKASIDPDGWFHTGDAGYMKNGELFLKERIKDLFKTSNGKYIAPQMIETKLVLDKYIDQAVIVADRHKFVSALLVPDYSLLRKYAKAKELPLETNADLCSSPEIHSMLAERIDLSQQDLAHYEKVKSFILLPEAFSIENGELTNTLKVKRNVVYERYAKQIEQMYAEAEAQHAKETEAESGVSKE